MALQLGALRDALIDAGARPEMAGKAAEELAAYDHQFEVLRAEMREGFAKVREDFAKVDARFGQIEVQFARIDERFTRVYWTMGVLIVMQAAVLGRLLFIH